MDSPQLELIRRSLADTRAPIDLAADLPDDTPATVRRIWPETLIPAAVLVPLLERGDGLRVILTERAAGLTRHPGQIAFPGGRVEAEDAGPLDTALRESEEEIGLPRSLVEPVGYLGIYPTVTGYAVLPVVALIRGSFEWRPDPREVTAVFDAPLDHLLDPAHHRKSTRRIGGVDVPVYEILFEQRRIWGATAAILVDFSRRIQEVK
ncbi:MAG: NUDIX hydrolase [Gammaproteobacteria bacterium]